MMSKYCDCIKQRIFKAVMILAATTLILVFFSSKTYTDIVLEDVNYTDNIYIELGDSYQIDLTPVPSNASLSDISYTSSNVSIASVEEKSGIIRSISPGEAQILITDGNNITKQLNIFVVYKTTGYEPTYAPSAWNGTIVSFRNCYTYAFDLLTTDPRMPDGDYFFDPGDAVNNLLYSGRTELEVDLDDNSSIIECVIEDICAMQDYPNKRDALIGVGLNDDCEGLSGFRYKVVLIVDTNSPAFHWYRQNPNGTWSHKPGTGAVTNKHSYGKIIYDPLDFMTDPAYADYSYVGCYAVVSWD